MYIGNADFDAEELIHHLCDGICIVNTPYGDIHIRRGMTGCLYDQTTKYSIFAPTFNFGGGMFDANTVANMVSMLMKQAIWDASLRTRR